jgi:Cdc6-like AAA superfamily ATPase
VPSERVQRQIDRLLDDAEAALARRDWPRVHELSQDVLALDPENADARTFLDAAVRAGASPASASQPATKAEPEAQPLPASFAGGRYAVRRFLGEGGRKRVYLAHDERLDRDVAIAIVKTEGLDEQGRARVRREAQAMGRLGDHPNIVTIHDVGDDDGQPYIVSQYMSGGAVDGLDLPLSAARTIEIAKDVCAGLAHAHKNGILHRDLKPGNVWLSADGTAEIGDFGLAVALEQSRLTMHGMLVGTVAYMPPEQALGSDVNERADLYSLGCMLYEMVTGRPPFVSDNPSAVISQHINTPPVAPSWHAESCPLALEELVLRLLAKDPTERPASAGEALAALERIDPAGKAATHSDSNVLDRLTLGVFVGREKELERLRTTFDNAVSGHGGLVMLVGEPGIGKTRTTQELETYAKMRGAQVLWGRTHESAGAPPYWPWIQAGNQYALAHQDDLPTVIGPQMTQEAINELTRIFPWLTQGANVGKPEEVSDPEVAQFRLFDAYAQYLKAIAHEAPLVIALDDLHWADKPTLLLLQHVARELSRTRILIVGNYRDTDITRQSALSETLASLNRETGFERIVLRGLTRDEVGAYIKARANVEPRREVLDRIFEETEGNAFFLSEVVNLMAQEGTLTKESISDIAIPDGVREALGRRLNRLTEETNELLQIAAIIGRDFTYDTLTLLGDRDEDALLKMVEEALEARVIEETEQAGRYRFTHAQMQETLLAELSTTRRVRLHGQVGEALEQRYGDHAAERAGRLAMHFGEAATLSPRFGEKAAKYAAAAGRQALAQAAYPEAARHFRAALSAREGQEMDEEMAALLADYARASYASAEGREGWRATRQAFDYYEKNGDGANAARVALVPKPGLSGNTLARLLERALALTEEDSEQYATLLTSLGESYGTVGNDDAGAQEALNRARQIADRLDSKPLRLAILLAHVWVDGQRWRPTERFQKATEAVAVARELNDQYSEMIAHR